MKTYLKKYREKWNKSAVSEIMGTLLLLAIAVITFSGLVIYVMSATDNGDASPHLNLVGSVAPDEDGVIVEHRGGESLNLQDTVIHITYENASGVAHTHSVRFDADGNPILEGEDTGASVSIQSINGRWDVGSSFFYRFEDTARARNVSIVIVDRVSNSIVMSGTVKSSLDIIFETEAEMDLAANFTWHPRPACTRDTITFDPSNCSNSTEIISYHWDLGWDSGNLDTTSEKEPQHRYPTWGYYTVTLNVTYNPAKVALGVRNWDTETRIVYVSDIPTITDTSDYPAYTGDSYTFRFAVGDRDGIDTATLEYWFNGGVHQTFSITESPWEESITIPLDSLETLHYTVTANDTLGFENSLPEKTVPVFDNDPPDIEDRSSGLAFIYLPFTFNASVVDNIAVDTVWVEYWWNDTMTPINESMNYAGGSYYINSVKMPNTKGTLNYSFAANDTSNNWARLDGLTVPLTSGDVLRYNETGPLEWYNESGSPKKWALTWALDDARPGDSILIFPGIYESTGLGANNNMQHNIKIEAVDPNLVTLWGQQDGISVEGVYGVQLINLTMIPKGGGTSFKVGILVNDADNITIKNCAISGAERGIKIDSSSNIYLYNCTTFNNTYGIDILDYSTSIHMNDCSIYDNTYGVTATDSNIVELINSEVFRNEHSVSFSNSDDGAIYGCSVHDNTYGISLLLSDNNNLTSNNIYGHIGDNGLYLASSDENVIESNDIHGNNNGVSLSGSTDNDINSNFVSSNNENGIYLFNSQGNLIQYNTIYDNNNHGIYLQSSMMSIYGNNQLLDNHIYENTGNGMHLTSSKGNPIQGNNVHDNTHGISLSSSEDNDLTSNTVYSNNGAGIYLSNSNDNTVITNQITENTGTGLRLDSCSRAVIGNNSISFNQNHGIHFSGTSLGNSYPIMYNDIWNNIGNGVFLDASSNNNQLFYNNIGGNSCGINISSSVSNTIRENNISTNGHGIYIQDDDCTDNTIWKNNFVDNTLHYIDPTQTNNIQDTTQAYDAGDNTVWYEGNQGNYWSDYVPVSPARYYLLASKTPYPYDNKPRGPDSGLYEWWL